MDASGKRIARQHGSETKSYVPPGTMAACDGLARPHRGHGPVLLWKCRTGYHARSRVEAKMRCLKAFGERIAARNPDRQTAEIHIRTALMNRFSALGTAEIVRVG